MITGGNEHDVHSVNINIGRDFNVDAFADIRLAVEGDACPRCAQALTTTRGIEVGHVFKLGTKYSTAMQAEFLDVQGKSQPMVMGCYGIGVGRTVAAAIEQSHDKDGIIFPASIAPFVVLIALVNPNDEKQNEVATNLYEELLGHDVEVLLDDRDERPGIKFKDADLIGIPMRVTVGRNAVKDGLVDIKWRKTGEQVQVTINEAAAKVLEALPNL
jgi:prolyl-tRNA synthetase